MRISLDSIYPSYDGSRILRVRDYMEMPSTCSLVNMQMMHGIYVTIDIQMLIIMYTLHIVCHYIPCSCTVLWHLLQVSKTGGSSNA